MLQVGQQAPKFVAPNQDGRTISLDDFLGRKNVVLYFYPKDDTPGCTVEANEFTKLADEFARYDTVVIGVSRDSCESHRKFIEKYGLKVELLADTDEEICRAYDVLYEKSKDGAKKLSIKRSTFVIDKEGKIVYIQYGVKPKGHAQEVLEFTKNLKAQTT